MTTKSLFSLPLAVAALAASLAGCGGSTAQTAALTTAPAVTTTPVAASTPAVAATTPAPSVVPTVGATVPATQVAAARAAGAHVYVSPNGDGSGLVVDPAAPLPAAAVADMHAAATDTHWPTDAKAFNAAFNAVTADINAYVDAGLSAFIVVRFPHELHSDGTISSSQYYMIVPINLPALKGKAAPYGPTVAAALSAGKAWFAMFPNVPVVTFNAVQ